MQVSEPKPQNGLSDESPGQDYIAEKHVSEPGFLPGSEEDIQEIQNTMTPGWSSEKGKLPHSPSHQRTKRTLLNGIETIPDITTKDL